MGLLHAQRGTYGRSLVAFILSSPCTTTEDTTKLYQQRTMTSHETQASLRTLFLIVPGVRSQSMFEQNSHLQSHQNRLKISS